MTGRLAGLAGIVRLLVWSAMAALAWRYLRGENWQPVLDEARRANAWLLVVAVLGNVALVLTKARRAHLLLAPVAPSPSSVPTRRLAGYFLASYAADNLIMSQAGPAVRVALVRRDGVPLAAAIACEGLQKVLEAAGLVPVLLVAALAPLPVGLSRPLHQSLMVAVACVLLVAGALLLRRPAGASSTQTSSRARRRLRLWLTQMHDAALALRRLGSGLEVVALTLGCWAIEVLIVLLTLWAVHLPAQLPIAALVVVAVSVAALIPGLPANVGPFEAAAVIALGAIGVDPARSLGFAVLFHAIHTVPVTVAGVPGFRRVGRAAVAVAGPGGEGDGGGS